MDNRVVRAMTLSLRDKTTVAMVFAYWLLYENTVFLTADSYGGAPFLLAVNALKILLPIILLFTCGLPSGRLLRRHPVGPYVWIFVLFLGWALVPTLVSGSLADWVKLLPRFVFFVSVLALFASKPRVFRAFAKLMIVYVVLALVQWVLVYLTGAESSLGTREGFYFMAGPFGLLGNINAAFRVPGLNFSFIRLCGFWNEPSNAAGSAYAAFYLCRYLVAVGERPVWRTASYACLAAGLLTLSTAGYFALGSTLLVSPLLAASRLTLRELTRKLAPLSIGIGLLLLVVYGRAYVFENAGDNPWLSAIVGVRGASATASFDASDGRLGMLLRTVATAKQTFIGVGVQEVGSRGIEGSGTAPVFWLLLTGFPGLALLLARETVLFFAVRSLIREQPLTLPLVQALVAVMAQHLSYGTWMNPNYFVLAAMVLVTAHRAMHPVVQSRTPESAPV